jgi:sirohydrochlorin ferrochelatase
MGFIVFAHGSRIESANQAVRDVAAGMAAARGGIVEAAFLELGEPNLTVSAARLVARGATRIVVLP